MYQISNEHLVFLLSYVFKLRKLNHSLIDFTTFPLHRHCFSSIHLGLYINSISRIRQHVYLPKTVMRRNSCW